MRKLLLLAATMGAVMAYAPPALGSESVSVVGEPGGVLCTTATCSTGISNSGSIELRGHLFGIESHSMNCNIAFTLRISGNGSGNISNVAVTPGNADCSDVIACATPWQFTQEETVGWNTSQLEVTICVDGTSLGECEGTVAVNVAESATNHRYNLSVNDGSFAGESFGKCELTGSWIQSGTINGFEIVHF